MKINYFKFQQMIDLLPYVLAPRDSQYKSVTTFTGSCFPRIKTLSIYR